MFLTRAACTACRSNNRGRRVTGFYLKDIKFLQRRHCTENTIFPFISKLVQLHTWKNLHKCILRPYFYTTLNNNRTCEVLACKVLQSCILYFDHFISRLKNLLNPNGWTCQRNCSRIEENSHHTRTHKKNWTAQYKRLERIFATVSIYVEWTINVRYLQYSAMCLWLWNSGHSTDFR